MKEQLIDYAKNALENSYSPYSNIKVGAALLTEDNKVFTGCNIENHGIQSICAERVAFSKAISQGHLKFKSIMIIGFKENSYFNIVPCGYCREFMSEFCDDDFVIMSLEKEYILKDLLPEKFEI